MRPTTDLAKNDSLLSTVDPDEVSDIVLAFLAWSKEYEKVPDGCAFMHRELQCISL
jgi:hypothetical protein